MELLPHAEASLYICTCSGSSILCVDSSQLCISCAVDRSNSNSTNIGMISRGLLVVRSIQVFRPISALFLAKITRMYAIFNFMLSLWSLLYALVAGVLALEAPRAFVLNPSKPPI